MVQHMSRGANLFTFGISNLHSNPNSKVENRKGHHKGVNFPHSSLSNEVILFGR